MPSTMSLPIEGGYARGKENMWFFELHILSPVLWEMEREGERAVLRTTHSLSYLMGHGTREAGRSCGSSNHTFSLLFCWGWYARGRENVWFEEPHILPPILWGMVRENVWFEEPHSPSCFVGDGKRGRTCSSSNHIFSLLFDGTWYARGREIVRFFEPHILSPVLSGLVRERKRECVVRRATHSPSYFVGDGTREAGRMCGSSEPHILPPVLWEMEREGERAVLRTTRPLSYLVGHGKREAGRSCGSPNHTFSLLCSQRWYATVKGCAVLRPSHCLSCLQ